MTGVTFRDLTGMDELRAAEVLQRRVWGEGDLPDPADLMMVIQAEGGLVGGAWQDGRLVGYVFGFPTRDPGVQHSHRLAVLAEMRGTGIGRRLKLYQRDWCLARGIRHVRWTFDPLRCVNAMLNIHRLGAVSGTYLPDYYGAMAGINQGLASDRLLVDWHLSDPRVAALVGQGSPSSSLPQGTPLPICLPEDIARLAIEDPDHASDLRHSLRTALQAAFAKGQRIVGFDPDARHYLLSSTP